MDDKEIPLDKYAEISGSTMQKIYKQIYDNEHKKHVVLLNGKTYTSIAEMCKKRRINYTKLLKYKNQYNLTLEQAIRVVRHLEKNHVYFAGKKYTNMQTLCEDAGLPFNKVKAYAVNRQISIHKAVRAFLKVQRAEGVRELAKKYGEQE